MTRHQRKAFYFAFEGTTAFAASFYASYIFFLLRDDFGFGNRDNLAVSAVNGLIYLVASWQAGRFAQRFGCHTSLRVSFIGLLASLLAGLVLSPLWSKLVTFGGWTLAVCFTWPAVEALVTEGEPPDEIPRMVGIYNITWAAASAVAYLVGGMFFEHLGKASLYWLPATIHLGQLLTLLWLERQPVAAEPAPAPAPAHTPEATAFEQPVSPATFMKMAWLANPFAYVAMNTVLAVIPGLAQKFDITVAQCGLFCSIWLFARFGIFVWLWRWTGWHYRFRWLLAAFLALIAGFLMILLSPHLGLLALGQVVFGFAAGLIYYSSLFYSMDVGETKGEHGGLHEAAIGAGNFIGPAIGAAALQFAPASPNAGTWAVSGVLLVGLAALVWLRRNHQPSGVARTISEQA
jgi:predicted MFS family arabinose efflux permease